MELSGFVWYCGDGVGVGIVVMGLVWAEEQVLGSGALVVGWWV